MKPIAILRHVPHETPGHIATFLEAQRLPWQVVAIDAGVPIPADPTAYAGLVFMGGPMSVNDDLPWIAPELALIRAAVAADVPVLGHCLGAQLIARALGGSVTRNPVKEIGWGTVRVLDNDPARYWFGDVAAFESFHWHGETFSIPAGAIRLMESDHCANQAYAIGRHLGLQCHVEMTEALINSWCAVGADEIAAADSPAVQTPGTIHALTPRNLPAMRAIADRLYGRWVEGLRP